MNAGEVREFGLLSLLYVSRSSLEASQEELEVANIVSIAVARNAELQVTGALLFTGAHFAQVLEGPREPVAELMTRIEADRRHRDVTTVNTRSVRERMFSGWAMAYSGRSPFLDRHLKPLLSPRVERNAREELVSDLTKLMIGITSRREHGSEA